MEKRFDIAKWIDKENYVTESVDTWAELQKYSKYSYTFFDNHTGRMGNTYNLPPSFMPIMGEFDTISDEELVWLYEV